MVSIPRCGRGDPGSNPGRGRVTETQSMWHAANFFIFFSLYFVVVIILYELHGVRGFDEKEIKNIVFLLPHFPDHVLTYVGVLGVG